MNDKDREVFDKWWQNIYDSYIEFRDWQGCDITFDKKEDMRIGWQAACEYKQREIDEIYATWEETLKILNLEMKRLKELAQNNKREL